MAYRNMLADFTLKCILVGDTGVGKSSLMSRFTANAFTDNFVSTIGVDFEARTIELDGKIIRVHVWDTSGQERFRSVTSAYFRGASGVIVVFDVTKRTSFTNLPKWMYDVDKLAGENTVKLLVGNKCDMAEERKVNYAEAKEYADSLGIAYVETSAKESTNVERAFIALVSDYKTNVLEFHSNTNALNLSSDDKTLRCCLIH